MTNNHKSKIILYIDSRDNRQTIVGLSVGKKRNTLKEKNIFWTSQSLLPLIQKILDIHKISFEQIDEIRVEHKSGSFTGLRVGVAVANTLGWILHIPVNGSFDPVIPIYS